MHQWLVPLALALPLIMGSMLPGGEKTIDYVAKRVSLKYPSSYVNLTSETWKSGDNVDNLIIAVKFESRSIVGQIYSIRFIKPDGHLEALLTASIDDGMLSIELYNKQMEKILNKPLEGLPINVHEQNLSMGLNTTSGKLWYKLASQGDETAEINEKVDISNSEIVVTLGGGAQSMIGCVALVAVSVGGSTPVAEVYSIGSADLEECEPRNPCTTLDCNTGRCRMIDSAPICDCYMTEKSGKNCRESAQSIQLRNNDDEDTTSSYLRYTPTPDFSKIGRITMDFRFSDSESKEGVLVYGETKTNETFKIYVVGMKGIVKMDNKNIMEFELRPDDQHSVIVKLNETSIHLYVDDKVQRGHLPNSLDFSFLQFGAPPSTEGVSEVGVTACAKNIYVDHHDVIYLWGAKDERISSSLIKQCAPRYSPESIKSSNLFQPDPLAVFPLIEDEVDELPTHHANLFPFPAKTNMGPPPSKNCEKSQDYMCQNGSGCKKLEDDDFKCVCKEGYIGKFCQFSILPRSCAEAYHFHDLPNGATWIDVDGHQKLEPSVVSCINGTTQIPHNMKEQTEVRDEKFRNNSLFILSYRDFKHPQLARQIRNSAKCSQKVTYRCNRAPLRFAEQKTWFKSVTNSSRKIYQIGKIENSCPCLDTGCQNGVKCNCDAGSIHEDSGLLENENSGISEIVTYFNDADVHADMSISDLRCEGFENMKPIRFVEKRSLLISEWSGESIDLQFRTSDASATILTVRGAYDDEILKVAILDGHTVEFRHLESKKTVGSQSKLNDSEWHHLLIELLDGEIRFTIDSTNVLMTIGQNAVLRGNVYLSSDENGIIGCFRNLLINDDSLDIQKMFGVMAGIQPSCTTQCTPETCQNGAKCYENFIDETPYCQCAFPGVHTGKACEIDINSNTSVSFHGGHLKFDNVSNVLKSPIFFSFRTDQTDALLFFSHDHLNNFIQVHLSEEVNLTLTLNNLDVVHKCTIRATGGTEFGDMRWIQVAITHSQESSQLQVDDAACTIRTARILSTIPIQRLLNVQNSDLVRIPIGLTRSMDPDPYSFTFVGNVDVAKESRDGFYHFSPKYDSPIPRFYGCIRGLQIDHRMLDMREAAADLIDDTQVRTGCNTNCESVTCANGGHCSVGWANYDPSATVTTCDCSRTSYTGSTCSLDEGAGISAQGFLEFEISKELSKIIIEPKEIPQLFKFAFSSNRKNEIFMEKQIIASVVFQDESMLEIELNKNRTINVAITYANGKADVLNFNGDFGDGFRHFVVVQMNEKFATAVMVDSLRQDFPFKESNLDMFTAKTIRIGEPLPLKSDDIPENQKTGFTGCVSNMIIDYQRGSQLYYTPIGLYSDTAHSLNQLITAEGIEPGKCASFEVPNSLPVYQNRVKFPIWETDFHRMIYKHVEPIVESELDEDNGSILWVLIIIVCLAIVLLLLFIIFRKCCTERERDNRLYSLEEPLNMTPTSYRPPQPSPPPQKKSATSNYVLPNPNVDFNKNDEHSRTTSITSSGISGYYTAYQGDDDSDKLTDDEDEDMTIRRNSSDADTIRHIDDDLDDDTVVVSRPTQIRHVPQRVSSFKSTDPTAPQSSPLYTEIRRPANLVPVPPPRITQPSVDV